MARDRLWRFTTVALRLYLGGLFLVACSDKILHPLDFAIAVQNYGILPDFLVGAFAVTLPWLELAAGICLFLGVWVRAATVVVTALLAMFLVAVVVVLIQGAHVDCGCLSILGQPEPITWRTVLRDAAWLAMSVTLLAVHRPCLEVGALLRRRNG